MYKSLKNIGLLVLSILFISSSTLAQKPRFKEKRVAKRVKKHVEYLASDELEGRATSSDGEKMSAKYIAEQFELIGLEHYVKDSYFQIMSIPNLRIAESTTSLQIDTTIYSLFTDFYPISASSNKGSTTGEIVNIGFGIEDEKNGHNDYKDVDVNGKTVVINLDLPGGTHPHSKYLAWTGVEKRAQYAKSKGAVAVLFHTTNEDLKPDGTLAKSQKNSGLPVLFMMSDLKSLTNGECTINVNILMLSDDAHNVLGYLDNGAENTVVVGAHHDHLGRGELGGSRAEAVGDIHNGADDNASGVAALIELARVVKKKSKKCFSKNNYLFIAFTGEEQGLVGSKYFVNSGILPADKTNYMINMDMVGHLDSTHKTLIINGVGTSPSWNTAINSIDYSTKKIAKIKTTESGIGASDHTSFYLNGTPAVHFFTGQHQYYHKPSDDVEIVNFGGEAFVISYIREMMVEMDTYGSVEFTKTKDESQGRRNFKVTLGIMPDYVYDGEGMRVDGVKEGKTGYKAGLLKGDIIISMNGTPINNMKDYMKVLSNLEKGTKTTVSIRRNEETKVLDVQF